MYDADVEAIEENLGWDLFAQSLETSLAEKGCDHTYRFTEAILLKVGARVWEGMKMWFEINKVNCDCDVCCVVADIAREGGLPTLAKFFGDVKETTIQ